MKRKRIWLSKGLESEPWGILRFYACNMSKRATWATVFYLAAKRKLVHIGFPIEPRTTASYLWPVEALLSDARLYVTLKPRATVSIGFDGVRKGGFFRCHRAENGRVTIEPIVARKLSPV